MNCPLRTALLFLTCFVLVHTSKHRVRPETGCETVEDCGFENTTCVDGWCECKKGLTFYAMPPAGCYNGKDRQSVVAQYSDDILKMELACLDQADCSHLRNAQCLEKECRCIAPEQYFTRPQPGCYTHGERKKLLDLQAQQDPTVNLEHIYVSEHPPPTACAVDLDCVMYENAKCADKVCMCQAGDVFRGYGEIIGCYGQHMPHLPRAKRTMSEKRTLTRKRRQELIDSTTAPIVTAVSLTACTSDADCTTPNSVCHPDAKICACLYGYYKETTNETTVCTQITIGTVCPTDGSDEYFCSRGVARAECCDDQQVCKCPEEYPHQVLDHPRGAQCFSDRQKTMLDKYRAWQSARDEVTRVGRPEK